MLKKILIVIVILIAIFAVIVALQPSEFRIARSITIAAPPATVFAQVNDLHKFQDWSPWAKLDPNAKTTFTGPATGVDSAFSWDGNNNVGAGIMTNIASQPNDLVRFRLDFLKPFAGTNTAEFTFKPEGNQTVVTWSMSGTNNFVGKAMSLIMNCDKLIGTQFEKGLADLKSVSEAKQ